MSAAAVYGGAGGHLALGHVVDPPRDLVNEAEAEVYNTTIGGASGSTERETHEEQQLAGTSSSRSANVEVYCGGVYVLAAWLGEDTCIDIGARLGDLSWIVCQSVGQVL